jgi:hypothetical protein
VGSNFRGKTKTIKINILNIENIFIALMGSLAILYVLSPNIVYAMADDNIDNLIKTSKENLDYFQGDLEGLLDTYRDKYSNRSDNSLSLEEQLEKKELQESIADGRKAVTHYIAEIRKLESENNLNIDYNQNSSQKRSFAEDYSNDNSNKRRTN